jgi:catechol 2,3-dioxygenase-like lactoylglutathione lyase family enzyme
VRAHVGPCGLDVLVNNAGVGVAWPVELVPPEKVPVAVRDQRFHHVKLPVTDVVRSRDRYGRVLGLQTQLDFGENGVLMGVALRDPGDTVHLALRHDPARATAMAGFDPIALCVPARGDLEAWQQRLDDLAEPHGGIVTGHTGRVTVGLHDPDGIEVRRYLPAEGQPEGIQ